jgi:outer membrane receptor protein involved in Fe transport
MALLVAGFVACGVARAEERLPEVVVTAPATDETPAPRDPTAFASVIETREAPASVETLTEALSNTVGVQVRRFGGLGDFSTVSVRGFSPGQVQVYLDGVPLSRADNETVNLSDLPLDAVDHVEVYRSVTPLAFAQSGPGGVVNIVTRRPTDQPIAAVSASGGSFDTRKASLAYGTASGAWDGLVFAQYLGSAGDFTFTDERFKDDPTIPRQQTRINNAFDQGDLTTRLAYHDDPFTLALTTDTFAKSQGVPGRSTVQSTTGHLDTVRSLGQVDLNIAPPGLPLGIDASAFGLYQSQAFSATADLAFPTTDSLDRTNVVGAQVLARGALGAHNVPGLLLAGSGERFLAHDGVGQFGKTLPGTAPARTRTRFTVAGEDEILLFGERVSIVPGVRWEYYHDVFPGDPLILVPALDLAGTINHDFVTPRLGTRADLGSGFTFLGNVGRSARVPNLTELFGNSGIVHANERHPLQPETATNWDAGGRWRCPWTNHVLTDATFEYAYFGSNVKDLIVLVPSSQSIFVPTNIGAATIRGDEVSVRGSFWDRLLLTTNYTYQDARDEGEEAFARGKRVPGRPANEAYVRLELVWSTDRPLPLGELGARLWPGRLYWDADLIGENFLDRANRQRVDGRALYGVGLDVALPWSGFRVAWEVKNLTNDQTEDALGFPLPGRSMFVTVSYGFGAPGGGK